MTQNSWKNNYVYSLCNFEMIKRELKYNYELFIAFICWFSDHDFNIVIKNDPRVFNIHW
jgi:hypothetical protein